MPQLINVGSNSGANDNGIYSPALQAVSAARGEMWYDNVFRTIKIPQFGAPVTATSLANNGVLEIIAALPDNAWLIHALTLQSSVAGKVDIGFTDSPYMTFNLVANVPFVVPIPVHGVLYPLENTNFVFQNRTGGAINVIVNCLYDYYPVRL